MRSARFASSISSPAKSKAEQGETVRRLARQVVTQLELRRRVLDLDQTLAELRESRAAIAEARAKSEELLLNILPAAIAEELKQHGKVIPRHHDAVTILFADFKGFTRLAEAMEPAALIQLLDEYFTRFDELAVAHGMEKLKTIGDSYMCVGGLPETNRTHPIDACLMGLAMQAFVDQMKRQRDKFRLPSLELRVGVHTGPVMSGIVGKRKFTYDIWGDAVNVASLLETNGAPGRVNISESTHHRVKELFETEARGSIEAKNKGQRRCSSSIGSSRNSPPTPRAVFPTSGSSRGAAGSPPHPRNGRRPPRRHRELNGRVVASEPHVATAGGIMEWRQAGATSCLACIPLDQ